MQKEVSWKWKIETKVPWFKWNLNEIWQYRDLLGSFVRRDLVANYQQTVFGPLWILLQPILTTIVYWIIFSRIASLSTDGVPPVLFYLPGIIIWNYFSDCLNGTMYTFMQNASMFNKVYFPRLIVPLSGIASQTIRMLVQLILFAAVYIFYLATSTSIHPNGQAFLLPLLIVLTAAFSFGAGLLMSILTARFRDLDYALQFILRLFMFATPVVYPSSLVPEQYRFLFWINPLTPVIETFRHGFFSTGEFHLKYLLITCCSVMLVLIGGITAFKKHELKVMDII